MLDSEHFFERVCEALGIHNGLGAKSKIAQRLGISKTSVGLWEKGEMPGRNSLESLDKIAQLSNASLHWLLTGEGPMLVTGKEDASAAPDVVRAGLPKSGETIAGGDIEALKALIRSVIQEEMADRPKKRIYDEDPPFSPEDEARLRQLPGIKASELLRKQKKVS